LTTDSKIRFFSIFIIVTIILSSCNRKNDVIPDPYVNFTLNLNDPQFVDLNALGGTVTVNSGTNNWGLGAAGFDGNGIIIHAVVDGFYAYDRTCPHDYAVNELSVRVNIDPSSSLFAICPQCSTKYSLPAGGTPASGIGRYPLKNYRARYYGGAIVTVENY